ncbi:hypothetical protein GCM10027435_04370 [Haloparvum alkalitolerans]|uniref:hypothetical protein n=1 Tax=Haloparvum alkalitolerans TaxID=1042953 RepID=UPI003CEE34F5
MRTLDAATVFDTLSRADLVLCCLPLLFAAGYLAGAAAFGTRVAAVAVGAAACWPVVADACLLHPPGAE